jgi:ABC-type transporter Mla subunit MlaD
MAATKMLAKCGAATLFSHITGGVLEKALGTSENGAAAVLFGLLSGYPTGAFMIGAFLESGKMSPREAQRLLPYVTAASPAFIIGVHIDKGIVLPRGTQMALVADGLLGGSAIELQLPALNNRAMPYQKGDTLPTTVVPGLFDNLQAGVLAQLDSLLCEANTLLATLNNEMEAGSLHATLQHIEHITADLEVSGEDIRRLTHSQLPAIINRVDTTMADVQYVANALREAELQNTVGEINRVIESVNAVLESEEGTLGLLLNDKALYENLNTALLDLDEAIVNVDSVVNSIKARPFIRKKLDKKK